MHIFIVKSYLFIAISHSKYTQYDFLESYRVIHDLLRLNGLFYLKLRFFTNFFVTRGKSVCYEV